MFQQVQGTVQSINSRETNGKFGPGFQFFIDIQDDTGNTITVSSNGKKPDPAGKGSDGNWRSITVGAVIHALYTVNGQYNNSKASQITVLQDGGPSTAQAPAPANPAASQPHQAPQGGGNFDAKTLGIKAGRAVNVAAQLVAAGIVTDVESGLREAIRLEVLSDKYYTKIYASEQEKLTAKAQPAANSTQHTSSAAAPQQAPAQQQAAQQAPVQQQAPQQSAPTQPPVSDGFDDDIPF